MNVSSTSAGNTVTSVLAHTTKHKIMRMNFMWNAKYKHFLFVCTHNVLLTMVLFLFFHFISFVPIHEKIFIQKNYSPNNLGVKNWKIRNENVVLRVQLLRCIHTRACRMMNLSSIIIYSMQRINLFYLIKNAPLFFKWRQKLMYQR